MILACLLPRSVSPPFVSGRFLMTTRTSHTSQTMMEVGSSDVRGARSVSAVVEVAVHLPWFDSVVNDEEFTAALLGFLRHQSTTSQLPSQ
jgi:hypothetical protein